MALRRMWDASIPPASPPHWEATAGYIGGNTPHVWTDAEWRRQTARWRLPIFVRSHDGNPTEDAAEATAWLEAHNVPKGATLALDYETRIDAAYLAAFDQAVVGWPVMVYGTRRTVLQNPEPSGGYWDAQWNNIPHLNPGSAATQYGGDTTLGQPYDASLVADSTPLWDTQEDDVTIDELRKELSTIGTPSRVALLSLMRRGVNSTIGADDNDEWGKDSPARKGIAAVVGTLPIELDLTKLTADQLVIIGQAVRNGLIVEGLEAKDGKLLITAVAT